MAVHKEAMVVDVWDFSRVGGGWSLVFVRDFNDWEMEVVERLLQLLHKRKIMSYQEDQLLLKGAKVVVFSTRLMYRKLVHSPPIAFPSLSIWNPIVPPKIGFCACEASWGKVLTLDQLKRRGVTLANRCFLYEEGEESIDHLLIHCPRAKMPWELFLVIVGSSWVFPQMVRQTLLVWQSANVGKKRKRIWMETPLCLFWTVWQVRNRAAFEDVAPLHIE